MGEVDVSALNGVNLRVEAGEFMSIMGASGSGKTTLLSILGCILSADRGSVQILDQDILSLDHHVRTVLRRNLIGFVFQRFHLVRGLTALNNVCVPLMLRGMTRRTAHKPAMALLDAVGLAEKAASHPYDLSAGQCQRVALARALVGDPLILLADEPTGNLDSRNGEAVMELLRDLHRSGATICMVTHDERYARHADRTVHLFDGRIVDESTERA